MILKRYTATLEEKESENKKLLLMCNKDVVQKRRINVLNGKMLTII